jgi:SpoVK/Ycf46/Vps4 family AAA+-type ATPase
MRQRFRAGSTSQFILYGSIHDVVPAGPAKSSTPPPAVEAAAGTPELELGGGESPASPKAEVPKAPEPRPGAQSGAQRYVSLPQFLTEVMFEPFDVVLHYDRGRGIRVKKGGPHFYKYLEAFDAFQGTSWAKLPDGAEIGDSLDLANLLPRDAPRALELMHRFLRGSQSLTRIDSAGRRVPAPLKVAVVLDYAHFIAPRADAVQLHGERSQVLIQLLEWASDPAILGAFVATVLITDTLATLNQTLVENPYNAKIQVRLPTAEELVTYVQDLTAGDDTFDRLSDLPREQLAARLVGLSRVNVRALILRALRNEQRLTHKFIAQLRKELIEKEAGGLVEFVESRRTLDAVAGHQEAKAWLRQDAQLLRRGAVRALPMGYLIAGRIGTGKTFLVTCLAGEVGVPVVELKNFRDKWVGATEGNLEKIFSILHALGQVIVFVDEADQVTGRRDSGTGDGGVSGRVYGMLAREMSDTNNRGKILWIFATSRPDLVEVDLKRQGRLDVHIPLFPPQDPESRHELFYAMARKTGLDLTAEELPFLPDNPQIGGNEMEGILVRALRLYESRTEDDPRTLPAIIEEVIADFRPSAHIDRLELMDLLAVKECTDHRFLPPRYRDLSLGEVNRRIAELRVRVGE